MACKHESSIPLRERVGLCAGCRFMLEQGTKRGVVFFRCTRADEDATFSRYPAIPVLHCRGFERHDLEAGDHGRDEAPGME